MEKNELLELLLNAVDKRENSDADYGERLAENQLTVLNRKLKEIESEKIRVVQMMTDAIITGKNHLGAYLKLENTINTEIKNLEKKIKNVQKGA